MADWFLPVPPVDTKNVKKYVDFIYWHAQALFEKDYNLGHLLSQSSLTYEIIRVTFANAFLNFLCHLGRPRIGHTTFIRHFIAVYTVLLRKALDMDGEENDGCVWSSTLNVESNTHTHLFVVYGKRYHSPMTSGSFANKMKKALYKIYVERAVSKVKLHLENTEQLKVLIRDRDNPVRLKVGKSFVCAKGSETFDKNDVSTWNLNKGFGQRWKTYYHGHNGRLLGYEGMVVLVVITVNDLPDFVKGKRFHSEDTDTQKMIDISSRESLTLDIEDALGRPREGQPMERPGNINLIGCPLDNDAIEHRGKPAKEGDGSVVYLVFRPDLKEEIKALKERVDQLKEENANLREKIDTFFDILHELIASK